MEAEKASYDQALALAYALTHSQHNLNLWVCRNFPTPTPIGVTNKLGLRGKVAVESSLKVIQDLQDGLFDEELLTVTQVTRHFPGHMFEKNPHKSVETHKYLYMEKLIMYGLHIANHSAVPPVGYFT